MRHDREGGRGKGVYGVVVIGAGTAGLVTAAGTAALGGRVALVERGRMGGGCLNYGCVPSKALIKSARVAVSMRRADRYGYLGFAGRAAAGSAPARGGKVILWSLGLAATALPTWYLTRLARASLDGPSPRERDAPPPRASEPGQ